MAILEKDLSKLFAYIDGIIVNNKSLVVKIGGVSDHIHILCTHPRTVTTAKLVEEIKRCSSRWLKTLNSYYINFAWQGGYAVFSVSASQVDVVEKYIINQNEHHKKKSFEEEYIEFLNAYNIKYDKDYVLKD